MFKFLNCDIYLQRCVADLKPLAFFIKVNSAHRRTKVEGKLCGEETLLFSKPSVSCLKVFKVYK